MARPGQAAIAAPRAELGAEQLGHAGQGMLLEPLAQRHHRRLRRQLRAQPPRLGARMLGRDRPEHEVGRRQVGGLGADAQGRRQDMAGDQRMLAGRLHRRDLAGIAAEEQHRGPGGSLHHHRDGRPPGPGSDHRGQGHGAGWPGGPGWGLGRAAGGGGGAPSGRGALTAGSGLAPPSESVARAARISASMPCRRCSRSS